LQWICDNHPETIDQIPWNLPCQAFKTLGFDEKMQQKALTALQEQITQLFQNKTGLWIIARHDKEHNEYELLVHQQNRAVTRIIDRTFEDQEKLWIIDFKTGKEDEKALRKHQQQLDEYGSCLLNRTSLPVYCGIYYLASNHWVNWQYQPIELKVC